MSIVNTVDTEKEILEVRIRGEKCCLNISHNDQLCNINRIVGGFFGPLEPGEAMTLSVILPTRVIYFYKVNLFHPYPPISQRLFTIELGIVQLE